MNRALRRLCGGWFVVACLGSLPHAQGAQARQDDGEGLFGLTAVHAIHIMVSREDYQAMEPPPPTMPFGPGGPGGRGGPPPGSADFGAGRFGFEFEYVPADVEIDGEALRHVGLRYKGNGTYLISARALKRSFKLDFDRYDASLSFHGLAKLNLNSGAMDPTKVREALAYTVFRAAGVAAPRTAFAEVWLSVPGRYAREYLGLYTVVEQVDKRFLKTHFGSGRGLLLKPEGIRGLPHFGDDLEAYKGPYNPRGGSDDEQGWQRLVELCRLINKADEAVFREKIREYLDVPAFVRFLAVNALLASLDGFIGLGHNYYLYHVPETGRFTFIPWDLDLAFGAFFIFGTPEQLADLSIEHPHVGENKLIDRLLAMPEVKHEYLHELRRLLDGAFGPEALLRDAALLEDRLGTLVARDREASERRRDTGFGFGPPGGPFAAALPVEEFVQRRIDSVRGQLAGRRKGYVPAMGFGPGFGPPGGPAGMLAGPLRERLDEDGDGAISQAEFAAGMDRLFAMWDTNGDGTLDEAELRAGLGQLMPPPGGGPPRPEGGFQPGQPQPPN
jgi:hypothetical protein